MQVPLEAQLTVDPKEGNPNDLFVADVSVLTSDGQRVEVEARWDWNGDGNWDTQWMKQTRLTTELPEAGIYPIAVEVSDNLGRTAFANYSVTVVADFTPPVASLYLSPMRVWANQLVVADAGASRAVDGAEDGLSFRCVMLTSHGCVHLTTLVHENRNATGNPLH